MRKTVINQQRFPTMVNVWMQVRAGESSGKTGYPMVIKCKKLLRVPNLWGGSDVHESLNGNDIRREGLVVSKM